MRECQRVFKDMHCWRSNDRETDRPFPEPAMFLLNEDGLLHMADYSNSPFCHPDIRILIEGAPRNMASAVPSCSCCMPGRHQCGSRVQPALLPSAGTRCSMGASVFVTCKAAKSPPSHIGWLSVNHCRHPLHPGERLSRARRLRCERWHRLAARVCCHDFAGLHAAAAATAAAVGGEGVSRRP